MTRMFTEPRTEGEVVADDDRSTWDEIRRLADELELKMHLASMDARDKWRALEPQLQAIEQRLTHTSERAGQAIRTELASMLGFLRKLRDELTSKRPSS